MRRSSGYGLQRHVCFLGSFLVHDRRRYFGRPRGWILTPVQWIMAVVMVIGIALVGNLNPLNLFKKKEA